MPKNTKPQHMSLRRRFMYIVLALIVLAATLLTATVALAQRAGEYSLGCWAITSSGGGQRQSANYRISDSTAPIAGQMTSPSVGTPGQPRRIQASHLALKAAFRKPDGGVPQPPPTGVTVIYLPLVRDGSLTLQYLCR